MSFSLKLSDNAHELVKVVARVRPMNASEISIESTNIVEIDSERNEVLVMKPPDRDSSNTMLPSSKTEYKPFTFDAVIDNSLTQCQIYDKVFRSLVNSVMEGFNGTIFAYGQTGTGKTFTMEGSLDSETNYGIIPKAFKQIFDQITTHREKRYLIGVSYFEIYQEEILDLLDSESIKKCVIHESPNGGIYIKGLSSYLCSNFTEISQLLIKGKKNRAVGATMMNDHSSRSHAIFQVTIETSDQSDVEGEHIKVGKLNLVDLAGSERVSKTGAEGQRLKEASKINLSLSSLGNVISALVDGAAFIPYRDSKLTRILQDSLGGNSRTIMVATVGPASYNYEETVNTLRYATRAKNIQNKPRLNENPKDAVLRKYQEEINRLRNMLEEQKARKSSATKPTTATEDNEGCKKIRLKTTNSKNELTSESEHPPSEPGMIQMMEISKLKELRQLLEPLGILFDGDIETIRTQLREKIEVLEKDTKMMKTERDVLSTAFKNAASKLESAEYECNNLMKQIKWLESKVLNSSGENELLQKTKSQKQQIEEKAKELESHKMRQEQLRKVLAEKEMTNEEAFANSNALENDYRLSLKKLDKINRKVEKFRGVHAAISKKHEGDVISLNSCIEEMTKELKLKKTIVDNFVPRKVRKDIDQRMRYDSTKDEYFVEPSEPKSNSCGRPKIDNSLQFPLFNFTRVPYLQPMENTFFTNENVLLLGPNMPTWPAVKFVADIANPRVDSLVKSALKDMKNTMIINCDHKGSKFGSKTGQNEAPSYVAVGPTILLRNVISDKFVDFSVVPSDVNLPTGSNITPLQTVQKSFKGTKFTHQQLLAFPLVNYTIMKELSFDEVGQKHNLDNVPNSHGRSPAIIFPSPQEQLQAYSDIRKLQTILNSEQIRVQERSGYDSSPKAVTPIMSSSRPSRQGTASSSITPTENSSLADIERDNIIKSVIDARLRKSVDPYELEMDQEMMNKSDPANNEPTKQYTDEERMLQRLHYFASRNEHMSQAKITEESQKNLKTQENVRNTNIRASRIPTPVKLNASSINNPANADAAQQRSCEFQNLNPPTMTRPPSRRHEFRNGDSYLG